MSASRPRWLPANCPLVRYAGPGTCWWCGDPLPSRRRRWCSDGCRWLAAGNHVWAVARDARICLDGRRCVRCGSTDWHLLEVNHLEPIFGRHAQTGCHHHLDGLETLCHDCHVTTTRDQFHARRSEQAIARHRGAGDGQLTLWPDPDRNLAMRMRIARGEFHPDQVSSGGTDLHPDYRSMAVTNGAPPDDPTIQACR